MVMAERSCWRSGTERRGGAVRAGSARGGRADWDTGGPISEAWAFAELRASSMGGGITTRAGLGCFCGLIADSFLSSLDLSFHYTQRIFSQALSHRELHEIFDVLRRPRVRRLAKSEAAKEGAPGFGVSARLRVQ